MQQQKKKENIDFKVQNKITFEIMDICSVGHTVEALFPDTSAIFKPTNNSNLQSYRHAVKIIIRLSRSFAHKGVQLKIARAPRELSIASLISRKHLSGFAETVSIGAFRVDPVISGVSLSFISSIADVPPEYLYN